MKAPQWTVRGVSHETRTAVQMAAKKAGMSLGDWLDTSLRTVATQQLKGAGKSLPPIRLDDVVTALSKVSERQREQGKVQSRIIEQLAETTKGLTDAQNTRFDRLASQDADQAKVLLAVAEKLDRKIETSNRSRDQALKALIEKLSTTPAKRSLFDRLLGRA